MLTLNINATAVDNQELLMIIDEIKKHLTNEETSASNIREDKSGQYSMEVKGKEEISIERFSEQILEINKDDLLYEIPTYFTKNAALYYNFVIDEFLIDNEKREYYILIDCDLDIDEEAMKRTAYDRFFKDLDNNDNFESITDVQDEYIDELLERQAEVYKEVLTENVLKNADFDNFAKEHILEASEYAIEKGWL